MNRGTLRFSKVGSDELLAEFPFSQAIASLARVRLTNAGNTKIIESDAPDDNETFGLYVGYTAAKLAKVKDLPEIKPKDVNRETMLEFSAFFDVVLEMPQTGESDLFEAGEVDENPTGTQAESSSD